MWIMPEIQASIGKIFFSIIRKRYFLNRLIKKIRFPFIESLIF